MKARYSPITPSRRPLMPIDALIAANRRSAVANLPVHYFVSEKDSRHGNALNTGFRQSTGEIMGWINSDDKYLPWTFRTVADIFEQHHDINGITGINAWWNDKGAMIEAGNVYKNIFDFLAGNFTWIQQESVFWRRSLWNKAGGFINEDYRLMVDGEL
jgi:Glycosyl transferase family 2